MAKSTRRKTVVQQLCDLRLIFGLRDEEIADSVGVCKKTIQNWKRRGNQIHFRPAYRRNLNKLTDLARVGKNVLSKRKLQHWLRGRDRLNHLMRGDYPRIHRRFVKLHYKLNKLEREAYRHVDRMRSKNRMTRFGK